MFSRTDETHLRAQSLESPIRNTPPMTMREETTKTVPPGVAVVHDEAAAVVPDVEGVGWRRQCRCSVAADGDALGEPLPEPEPRADSSSTAESRAMVALSATNEYTVRTDDMACSAMAPGRMYCSLIRCARPMRVRP